MYTYIHTVSPKMYTQSLNNYKNSVFIKIHFICKIELSAIKACTHFGGHNVVLVFYFPLNISLLLLLELWLRLT